MENSDKDTNDEQIPKKPRLEKTSDDSKIESKEILLPNVSSEENKQNTTEIKPEEVCSLCMEASPVVQLLPAHQCPQCAKDAWKICQCCNETLLSRTCPMCRGEYAPIVMSAMPGLPLVKLADPTLTVDDRSNLLYKFGIIRHLISKSNVALWTNDNISFSLPQNISSNPEESTFVIVSIPFTKDRLQDGQTFYFTNKIWDEIEEKVESGAVQAGETVNLPEATKFILAGTKENDHLLFTMLSPSDWVYMLDPKDNLDTSEALVAIRNSIFEPLISPSEAANK